MADITFCRIPVDREKNKNFAEGYVAPGKDHVTLSDNALYSYQVLSKYLKGFQNYRVTDLDNRVKARVVENVDRRTYRWKIGSLYRTMPAAGATTIDSDQTTPEEVGRYCLLLQIVKKVIFEESYF